MPGAGATWRWRNGEGRGLRSQGRWRDPRVAVRAVKGALGVEPACARDGGQPRDGDVADCAAVLLERITKSLETITVSVSMGKATFSIVRSVRTTQRSLPPKLRVRKCWAPANLKRFDG